MFVVGKPPDELANDGVTRSDEGSNVYGGCSSAFRRLRSRHDSWRIAFRFVAGRQFARRFGAATSRWNLAGALI